MSDLTPREAARAAHRAPEEADQAAATSLDLAPEVEQTWLRPRGRDRYPGAVAWTPTPPPPSPGAAASAPGSSASGSSASGIGAAPADPADATDTATRVDPVGSPRPASSAVSRRTIDPFGSSDAPRSHGRRASPTLDPEALAAERLASDRATIAAQGEALRRVAQARLEENRRSGARPASATPGGPGSATTAPSAATTPAGPSTTPVEAVRPRPSFAGETQLVPQAEAPGTAAPTPTEPPAERRLVAGGTYSAPLRAEDHPGVGAAVPEPVAPVAPPAEAAPAAAPAPVSEGSQTDVDVATRAITIVRAAGPAAAAPASQPRRTLIMGILNVTLDSFSDGGRYARFDDAIAHARSLAADGADIIDVGGESTRPGAPRVEVHEEQRRVIPVIRELVGLGLRVSVDTMNAATAFAAVTAGAEIVNDVSGGLHDPHMAQVVTDTDATYIAMHWRGRLDVHDSKAVYANPVAEVKAELFQRVAELVVQGVNPDRIVIDPGLGFSKRAEHNWQLLGHLHELSEIGLPILVAASRKRFLGGLLPEEAGVQERDPATAVISALSAQAEAWGVRVHDVASTRASLDVWDAWQKGSRG